MELKEYVKLLEQFKEECDKSNLKTLLFVTDRKNFLFGGSYNRVDVKNLLFYVLKRMDKSERVETINAVLKEFTK